MCLQEGSEELGGGRGAGLVQGQELDADAEEFDAQAEERLGGVPADLVVVGAEKLAEAEDRFPLGVGRDPPLGLELCGLPPLVEDHRPHADGVHRPPQLLGDRGPGHPFGPQLCGKRERAITRRFGIRHGKSSKKWGETAENVERERRKMCRYDVPVEVYTVVYGCQVDRDANFGEQLTLSLFPVRC